MKDNELKKAAETEYDYDPVIHPDDIKSSLQRAFIKGAQWQEVQGWISVDERLPDYSQELICDIGNKTVCAIYTKQGFEVQKNHGIGDRSLVSYWTNVIAWMPMPLPSHPINKLKDETE